MAKKRRINWRGKIRETVLEAIETSPVWRFPTVRSIWYYLSDALGLIPATEQGYKQLDKLTVQMRRDEEIPFGYFNVERGVSEGTDSFISPERKIKSAFNHLLTSHERYKIPIFYNQPILIEVWCEKKGLIPTFSHLVGDRITIRSPEGFSPWEFINYVTTDIKDYYEERQNPKIIILYFGDQDPSGIQIWTSLQEQMDYFKMNYEMPRLGVTLDQIKAYNLPTSPRDVKAKKKLLRDPRYKKYVKKYGKTFCELDSFISLAPEEFRRTLEDAVQEHVDEDALSDRDVINEELKRRFHEVIEIHENEIEELGNKLQEAYRESE